MLDRGGFTAFVADSSFSYTLSGQSLYEVLCDYLKQGTAVDLKFNYLGTQCAGHWLALSQDPTYGHSQLQTVLSDNADEIVERCGFTKDTLVDLVSLGPGDGLIDRTLIHALQKCAKFQSYYPLDISFDLLQRAVKNITEAPWLFQGHPFAIKAIHGDFTELKRYRPVYGFDPSVNFFALVGFSLGNYNEAQLLGKIREGMQPGDYLLIDARLHGGDFHPHGRLCTEDKEKVLRNYQLATNNRFAFGPVEVATFAELRQVTVDLDVTNTETAVPCAVNVRTYCKDLGTRFRHDNSALKRDRLNLAQTTQYSFSDLSDWLGSRDLDLVWKIRAGDTGLFLLRNPPEA